MNRRNFLLASAATATAALRGQTAVNDFFARNRVHPIKLTIKESNWWEILDDRFRKDDNTMLEADLEWGAVRFARVGVRFKGNSSYGHPGRKKGMRIRLNFVDRNQRLGEMTHFNLNNNWNDPSFVRESIWYDVMGRAGLTAARHTHASVTVNGEAMGHYLLVEHTNAGFLRTHFGEDAGNLFSTEIGASFDWLGEEAARYAPFYELETNTARNDYSALLAMIRTVNQEPIATLREKLEPQLDVINTLVFMGVNNVLVNLDSYIDMAQNYLLYHRPADKRFIFIPWDGNLAFGAFSFGTPADQLTNIPFDYAGSRPCARPLVDQLMKVPLYREIQQDVNRWLVSDPAHPERIAQQAQREQEVIAESVAADRGKMFSTAAFAASLQSPVQMVVGAPGGGPGLPGGPGGGGGLPGGGQGGAQNSPRCVGVTPPGGPGGIGPGGGIGGPGGPGGMIPGVLRFYEDRARSVQRALGLA
jgi:hypothetical protein